MKRNMFFLWPVVIALSGFLFGCDSAVTSGAIPYNKLGRKKSLYTIAALYLISLLASAMHWFMTMLVTFLFLISPEKQVAEISFCFLL